MNVIIQNIPDNETIYARKILTEYFEVDHLRNQHNHLFVDWTGEHPGAYHDYILDESGWSNWSHNDKKDVWEDMNMHKTYEWEFFKNEYVRMKLEEFLEIL